ncbi:MAG: cadherin-like domain-containing protein, partial [Candidatus Parabeggiatoa sp.]|nr:cadherin-like domain-containing protein [Candidatus Parabeggiatoa sp.]
MKKHILLGVLIPFVYAMSQIAYAEDCFEGKNADACYYDEDEDTVAPPVKDSQNAATTTSSSQKNNPPQSSPANSSSNTQTTKPSQQPATTGSQKQPATGSEQSTTGSGKNETGSDTSATGNGTKDEGVSTPSGPVQWIKGRVGNVVIIYLNAHSDYSGVRTLVFNIRPRNGQVTNNKDGTLTYTPNPDFDGVDSLTYTLTDQEGHSSTVTIKILVMKADDEDLDETGSSKKAIQTAQTKAGGTLDLQLANNEDISQLILNPSENSQVRDNQDGTLTYIPNPGFSGTDQFSYTVIYLQGQSYTFIVKIDVGERDFDEMNTVVVAEPSINFYTDHKAITHR